MNEIATVGPAIGELSAAKAVALVIEANEELAQKICKDLNIPHYAIIRCTIERLFPEPRERHPFEHELRDLLFANRRNLGLGDAEKGCDRIPFLARISSHIRHHN